jgi:subtilisin
MRRAVLLFAVVGAAVLLATGVALAQQERTTPQQSGPGSVVPDEYIVVFKDTVPNPSPAANEIAQQRGLSIRHTYEHVIKGFAARIPAQRLAALRADPRVEKVEQVRIQELADDEMPKGVDRAEVDLNAKANSGSANTTNANVAVGIIDSGIYKHTDLDVKGGRNFVGGASSKWNDGNGHGTHVAGIVGAKDNGSGVIGVAPGADLWAVRTCQSSCWTSDMVKGIDWMAERKKEFKDGSTDGDAGIDFAAANMSISTSDDKNPCSSASDSVHRAICGLVNEGVVFAMAAGNNGSNKNAYPEAIAVSALSDFDGKAGKHGASTCRDDEDDTLANFSNYGPEVDIAAPGVCIKSTWNNGGYSTISGTSMASPHVAGAIALYLHANNQAPARDAAGVDTIRRAILDAAKAQSDTCGYTNEKASEESGEPLLFVNGSSFGGADPYTCEVAQPATP